MLPSLSCSCPQNHLVLVQIQAFFIQRRGNGWGTCQYWPVAEQACYISHACPTPITDIFFDTSLPSFQPANFQVKVTIPCLNSLSLDNWPVLQWAYSNLGSITIIGIGLCNYEGWEVSQSAVSKLENRKPAVYSAWEPGTLLRRDVPVQAEVANESVLCLFVVLRPSED